MERHQEIMLGIVRRQLFGGDMPELLASDIGAVLREAKAQTVLVTVFPSVRDLLRESYPQRFAREYEAFLGNVMTNTANFMEHDELHCLMTAHGIPYCTLKGMASAYYYPEPSLREMGDVDFLVREEDFETVRRLVLGAGFTVDHGDEPDSIHLAYHRPPFSVWEQHRAVNGVPGGAVGQRIRAALDSTIGTAETVSLDGAACRIPDAAHHGLIMLLHVASHMTGEGIGLRHLCDWAVFADRLSNDEFVRLFDPLLRECGLWSFAQILTMVAETYLGIARKPWAQAPGVTDSQLAEVMGDILSGGNFGTKDLNRYREIKYIANRGERTVDDRHVAAQVFDTLDRRTREDYPRLAAVKPLLPLGWAAEGCRYLGLLLSGRRKTKGTSAMLREAARRKDIYSRMRLFETEETL